jgi:hypothetical protein
MSVVIEKGYRTKLHWINETTEGSAPSGGSPTPTYKTMYAFVDFRISRPELIQPTIDARDYSFIEVGHKTYEIPVTYFPTDIELLTETITNVETKTQTLWFEYPSLNTTAVVSGCKANRVRLSTNAGELVQAGIDFFGVKYTSTAPTANRNALPTAAPFHSRDSAVRIDGTTAPEFRGWSVEINNNLEHVPSLGTTEYRAVRERHRDITGELTGTFESTAHLTKLLNNTEFSLAIDIGKEGSTTRTLTITGCKWLEHPIPSRKTDLILLRLRFRGKTVTLA